MSALPHGLKPPNGRGGGGGAGGGLVDCPTTSAPPNIQPKVTTIAAGGNMRPALLPSPLQPQSHHMAHVSHAALGESCDGVGVVVGWGSG